MLWSSWSFECITFDYFLGISFDCMAFWLFARSEVVLYDSFCEHRGIEHHGSKDRCSRVGWTKSRETGALLSFNTHDTCILRAIQGVVHPQMHTPNICMGYTGEKFNPRILSRFFSLKRRLEKNPWQFSPSAWPPFWRYAMYYEFETRGVFSGYTASHFGPGSAEHMKVWTRIFGDVPPIRWDGQYANL